MPDPDLSALTDAEKALIGSVVKLADELVADSWPAIVAACDERPDRYVGALAALTIVHSGFASMLDADETLKHHGAPAIPPLYVLAVVDRMMGSAIPRLVELLPDDQRDGLVAAINESFKASANG
jgi:hypothetical protein